MLSLIFTGSLYENVFSLQIHAYAPEAAEQQEEEDEDDPMSPPRRLDNRMDGRQKQVSFFLAPLASVCF